MNNFILPGKINVLIGCEYSGRVREAFNLPGFNSVSCDFEPTDISGKHYQGNIFDIINQCWDVLIAFPPCTYLCSSGARWFSYRKKQQNDSLQFFIKLYSFNIKFIALENPVGVISTKFKKPDQIIQPWMFGDGFQKSTCLWLKNLPTLVADNIVDGRYQFTHLISPNKNRSKIRSLTYPGIARAMGSQWSDFLLKQDILKKQTLPEI